MRDFEAMAETIKRAESIIRATHAADDIADNLYALGCELGRDTTYNGWTNYPTWAINLWLSNDRGLYEQTCEMSCLIYETAGQLEQVRDGIWNLEQARRFNLADQLMDWVTNDLAPDLGATFASDLLGYALSQVDWNEIADAWLEDAAETVNA